MLLNKNKKLIIYEEVNGEFVPKRKKINKIAQATILSSPVFSMIPSYAQAQEFDPVTNNIHSTIMSLFDAAVVLIVVFSGGMWALGHRTKAIHLLISCCAGYLLARNAVAIRDLLKSV